MSATFVILLAATVAALVLWLVVLGRVARSVARMPHVRDGVGAAPPVGGWPAVFVVVPAHNEERVIDACAKALRAQDHPRLNAIFVLDRCSDASAEIVRRHAAADPRVIVLENDACPPGWAGKCHAAWIGAEHARTLADGCDAASILIFTDADTAFDPRLVRASVACAVARDAGLLSLLPRLTTIHRFERMVQPVASMTLMRMYPIERVDHPRRPRPFANGQFLLFRRGAYDAVGGHAAVRNDLLEDLAFGRRMVDAGRRVSLLAADELLEVSMYDSLEAFERGWTRIFIEACQRRPSRLRKNAVRALVTGVAIPLAQAALAVVCGAMLAREPSSMVAWLGVGALVASLAAQAVALAWIYALAGAPRSAILAYPLGSIVVARCLWTGATDLLRRRPIRWGGREYVLDPR
ncbi:MAG: glycosyltransferase family 2 protein [Phycisphaerales bacterium]